MTKLFLVIVGLGTVNGTVGPLPYSMKECEARAAEFAALAAETWRDPEKVAKLRAADPRMGPDSVTFECREVAERPMNGTPWIPLQR